MVRARLHMICGNCGCSDEFKYYCENQEISIGDQQCNQYATTVVCDNCATLHDLEDNARNISTLSDVEK